MIKYFVLVAIMGVFFLLSLVKAPRNYVKADITDSVLHNDPKFTKYDKNGNAVHDCKGKYNHFTASFKNKGGKSQTVKVKQFIGCDTKVHKNGQYKMYYTNSSEMEKSLKFATAFDNTPFLPLAGATLAGSLALVAFQGHKVGKLLKQQDRMTRRYNPDY